MLCVVHGITLSMKSPMSSHSTTVVDWRCLTTSPPTDSFFIMSWVASSGRNSSIWDIVLVAISGWLCLKSAKQTKHSSENKSAAWQRSHGIKSSCVPLHQAQQRDQIKKYSWFGIGWFSQFSDSLVKHTAIIKKFQRSLQVGDNVGLGWLVKCHHKKKNEKQKANILV